MKTRFHNISVFRLVATLALIFFHILYIGWPMEIGHWSLLRMNMLGLTAISGFLAGRSQSKVSVKSYYANRALRLLPPAAYCFGFMMIWSLIYYCFHWSESTFANLFFGQRAINGEPMFIAGNYYYLIFFAICVAITPLLWKGGKWAKITVGVILIYELVQSFFLTTPMDSFIMVLPYVIGYYMGAKKAEAYLNYRTRFPFRTLAYLWLCAGVGALLYVASHYWIDSGDYWRECIVGFIRSWGIFLMTVGGLFSFLLLLRRLNAFGKSAFLDYSDRISYFVFLMDQCFVVAGTSVLWMSDNRILQVILVYSITLASSMFLHTTYLRFFGKKNIRIRDVAKGYRWIGYLVRWFVPYVPACLYRPVHWLTKIFARPTRISGVRRSVVYLPRDDGSKLRLVVYRPKEPKTDRMTAVTYFHGGGYAMGSADRGKPYLEIFLRNADCVVASVDYRLSYASPYPAPIQDGVMALAYLRSHYQELGINPNQIFVFGESAGGGLAAGLCLYCRDKGIAPIAAQIALYPMLDDRDTESSEGHDGPIWNQRSNREAWRVYLKGVNEDPPSYACPARAQDFSRLPPLISYVGDLDAFYAEDLSFYHCLLSSGVAVDYRIFPGCFHSFDTVSKRHPISRAALSFLEERFHYAQRNYYSEAQK